jgi:hypothetical protein|tara:strand:- start:3371 stop:4189 length:819 start_codon:yes stop_codon:yes gene_type:complete
MAQQVKRSPGRPKAQPATAVAEAPKKRTIKRKEQDNRTVEYEIPKRGGIVFMLPQKGITVYDEEKDTIREMRYCPNEPSIWADEQSDNAVKQTVAFREGRLFVPKEKPNLRKFMEKHPMNMANGGKIFREVNKKKDAEAALQREFKLTEAVALVRDKDITDLLPIALYFKVNINQPTSEIRYNLLNIAKKKTQEFIEAFDSPEVTTRATIQQASDYQIINLKESGCYWFDSNSLIVAVPAGQEPMDVLVRFCLTEKGAPVLSDIEARLDKLA